MKYLIAVVLLAMLGSCGLQEENDQLKAELAAMKGELETNEELNNELSAKMSEVGMLLDSIDQSETDINLDLEKGTSYEAYTEKIRNLNEYLEQSRRQVEEMENALAESGSQNKALSAMISNYKRSLEQKEEKIKDLQNTVEKYRNENKALITTVDLQKREIRERDTEIMAKRLEVETLEENIEKMLTEAKEAEANAYFMRAMAMEEAGNRTKLAPKKKKETYKKAYDLYKQAFEAGRTDAFEKMEELEDKL